MPQPVSYHDIKGTVSSLLLLWSELEQDLRDLAAKLYDAPLPKSAHGLRALIGCWHDRATALGGSPSRRAGLVTAVFEELIDQLEFRNAVCHGLQGYRAEKDGHPAMLICALNDIRYEKTWDELQAMFSRLARLPRAISVLSCSDVLPEDRWWREEFDLRLP